MLEHSINHSSSNLAKIKLFRSLFVGREDVFARRYENEKKGTSGYTENQTDIRPVYKLVATVLAAVQMRFHLTAEETAAILNESIQ